MAGVPTALRRLFCGLYIAFGFLTVRNIYRFIEFLQASGKR